MTDYPEPIREVARGLSEHRTEFREFREEARAGFQMIADLLRRDEPPEGD